MFSFLVCFSFRFALILEHFANFVCIKKTCWGHLLSAFDEYQNITVICSVWSLVFRWLVGISVGFAYALDCCYCHFFNKLLLLFRLMWLKTNKKGERLTHEEKVAPSMFCIKFNICIVKRVKEGTTLDRVICTNSHSAKSGCKKKNSNNNMNFDKRAEKNGPSYRFLFLFCTRRTM